MSETVIILGAGASVHAGAPVMRDFLDRAEQLLRGQKVEHKRSSFDLVFRGIAELNSVFAKALLVS